MILGSTEQLPLVIHSWGTDGHPAIHPSVIRLGTNSQQMNGFRKQRAQFDKVEAFCKAAVGNNAR